jgi:hypothetical protein
MRCNSIVQHIIILYSIHIANYLLQHLVHSPKTGRYNGS